MLRGLEPGDKLCMPVLRDAFTIKRAGQRGGSGPSVGLTGGISHGGPPGAHFAQHNGNEELMEMPI